MCVAPLLVCVVCVVNVVSLLGVVGVVSVRASMGSAYSSIIFAPESLNLELHNVAACIPLGDLPYVRLILSSLTYETYVCVYSSLFLLLLPPFPPLLLPPPPPAPLPVRLFVPSSSHLRPKTLRGGQVINEKREAAGMRPLAIVATKRTDSSSLSSTHIRDWIAKHRWTSGL